MEAAGLQLKLFCDDDQIGGQIAANGVDLSLKKVTFDVGGTTHMSAFEKDADGNVTHYEGTVERTSGTADSA